MNGSRGFSCSNHQSHLIGHVLRIEIVDVFKKYLTFIAARSLISTQNMSNSHRISVGSIVHNNPSCAQIKYIPTAHRFQIPGVLCLDPAPPPPTHAPSNPCSIQCSPVRTRMQTGRAHHVAALHRSNTKKAEALYSATSLKVSRWRLLPAQTYARLNKLQPTSGILAFRFN